MYLSRAPSPLLCWKSGHQSNPPNASEGGKSLLHGTARFLLCKWAHPSKGRYANRVYHWRDRMHENGTMLGAQGMRLSTNEGGKSTSTSWRSVKQSWRDSNLYDSEEDKTG